MTQNWLETTDLPKVVTDLSPLQVLDGVVLRREHPKFAIPVSAAGIQYAKRSGLGGQRLYLTEHDGSMWLCFPFSDLHARFVYNNDAEYHARMNFHRIIRAVPHPEYLPPSQILDLLYDQKEFPFSMEVLDVETSRKRQYTRKDFLADMVRGPAANLADSLVNACPNYLRPFFTALGVDAFALIAPPSESSDQLVFALNRPWPVWVNPSNFDGVSIFLPAGGEESVGISQNGINENEVRKRSNNYAATREAIVDAKGLLIADMKEKGIYENGQSVNVTVPFHDIMVPYTSGETHYPETISSNVFVVIQEGEKKVLLTPPALRGNYPGITRFFVLKLANEVLVPMGLIDEVKEGPITQKLLQKGTVLEMFRTGSASGINFVNRVVWFDKKRYEQRSLTQSIGAVTSVISEVFEGVARGYSLGGAHECLRKFASLCVRLEIPEAKISGAMPTFSPPSVNEYPRSLVLEGVDLSKASAAFRRGSSIATAHDFATVRQLGRSR